MDPDAPNLNDYCKFADTVPESVLIVNEAGEVVIANTAARETFLSGNGDFFAKYVYQLVPEEWRNGHDERMRYFMKHPSPSSQMTVSDVPALRSNGTTFRVSVRLKKVELQEGPHVLAICHDVTGRVEKESELRSELNSQRNMANEDPLTSLANSRYFKAVLDSEIERCARHDCPFAIVYFDLDNFKPVNDELGHTEGDRVLKTIASVLKHRIRAGDLAGRLGGDEFAILLPDTQEAGAEEFTRAITQALDAAMAEGGWKIGLSVGVATFSQPPASSDQALSVADQLMYEAKKNGKNRVVFRSYV